MVNEREILIVEDEPEVAIMLGHNLEAFGFHARIAYSAQGALDLLAEFEPQLILLDIHLPDQNGFALLRELRHKELFRKRPMTTPVIVISGREIPPEHCHEMVHVSSFLRKPYSITELTEAIGRALKKAA